MRRALVAGLILVGVHATNAAADTEAAIRGTPGRYGDAGCGLGSMAFGSQPGMI
jgi:hypothetical protein